MKPGLKQAFENPLKPKWSVKTAILERVEYEDMVRWAQQRDYPFRGVKELPEEEKPPLLALWRFAQNLVL